MRRQYLVSLVGVAVLCGSVFGTGRAAFAQYVNPYTGNNWNNPNSSLLDTARLGARNQMLLQGALNSSLSMAGMRAAYNQQVRLGESRIKSGKATTRAGTRPFPMDYWIKQTGGTTPAKRKQMAAELVTQREIWMQETRRRQVDTGDMAQALGLAFVLAWEGHTGDKPTPAQFKGITQDFRTMLLKTPVFQGMSAEAKKTYLEGQLINATDPIRLLRTGERTGNSALIDKGRAASRTYVNSWLPTGYTRYAATPTGFQEQK